MALVSLQDARTMIAIIVEYHELVMEDAKVLHDCDLLSDADYNDTLEWDKRIRTRMEFLKRKYGLEEVNVAEADDINLTNLFS